MKLGDEVRLYLAERRAIGYALKSVEPLLTQFCLWLRVRGKTAGFTVDDAVEWARDRPDASPIWWSQRLSAVRPFAAWLNARGAQIPLIPAALLPGRTTRREPFIYSQADLDRLLAGCQDVFANPRVAATMRCLIGLMAATGIRTGEALAATVLELNIQENLLLIRGRKTPLDRLVALHPTTTKVLCDYLLLPERIATNPAQEGPIFVNYRGHGYSDESIEHYFRTLIDSLGLASPGRPRPRLHDLRHTFATRHMITAYRNGLDPARTLTLLTTCLGHTSPEHTYWYLSAVPELLEAAALRMQRDTKKE